jgi:hypothetical protein
MLKHKHKQKKPKKNSKKYGKTQTINKKQGVNKKVVEA